MQLTTNRNLQTILTESLLPKQLHTANGEQFVASTAKLEKVEMNVAIASWLICLHRMTNEHDVSLDLYVGGRLKRLNVSIAKETTLQDILNTVNMQLQNEACIENEQSLSVVTDTAHLPYTYGTVVTIGEKEWYVTGARALMDAQQAEQYVQRIELLMEAIKKTPYVNAMDVPLLLEEEKAVWAELNDTAQDVDVFVTMHDVFRKTANQFPEKIALQSKDASITFGEIERLSNQIANALIEKDVRVGDYVAVYMMRSIEAIVAMFGVMKAGAVYVPLSPDNPDDRNEYIMKDAATKIVITDENTLAQAKNVAPSYAQFIAYETFESFDDSISNVDVTPTDIAYIIYTSGSTGNPKGVKIPHKSIATFGYAETGVYDFKHEDVLTQFYTLTFDASMLELCPMIFTGVTLYMLSKAERIDVNLFAEAVAQYGITGIPMIPMSVLKQFALYSDEAVVEAFQQLRYIGVGGEALSGEVVRSFQRKFGLLPLLNIYGPTECSVLSTFHPINGAIDDSILNVPIGKPLPNYRTYIMNERFELCPIGVPGELMIATTAHADGYLHLPEKTAEVFVENPKTGEQLYHSGDIVKLLPNGTIEFVGRKDSQVKIRGFRVELGEIEEQLLNVEGIKEAVIVVKTIQDELTIVAYYNLRDGIVAETHTIIESLKEKVPSYMIPAYFEKMDVFPLLPSGKIDRKSLQRQPLTVVQAVETSPKKMPTNEVEQKMVAAWGEVLQLPAVGIDEDFFEIGGHSLKVLAVLTILKKDYPMLQINDFFEYRTIEALAKLVERKDATATSVSIETNHPELIEHPAQLTTAVDFSELPQNHVLLTGATGYLGAHILIELLKIDAVTPYVLVRAADEERAYERVEAVLNQYAPAMTKEMMAHIVAVPGDFTKANLGLSPELAMALRKNVQSVIHCGADVRHFGDLETFKKTNIDSTAYLADFAEQSEARFHYVSTLGVQEDLAVDGNWDEFLTKTKITEAPDVTSLYTNSKLASEKLLQKRYENGLPVTIYRPGNLTCHSVTGQFQKNIDANAVYRMFKSFILLKKAPDVSYKMDFTMIDYASETIAKISQQNETIGGVFNICNTMQVAYRDVLNAFTQFGYAIDVVSEDEFNAFLYDDTAKNKEGLELAMAAVEGDGAKNSPLIYACPETAKQLEKLTIHCPKVDQAFFTKMIQYAIEIGYFPQP